MTTTAAPPATAPVTAPPVVGSLISEAGIAMPTNCSQVSGVGFGQSRPLWEPWQRHPPSANAGVPRNAPESNAPPSAATIFFIFASSSVERL